MKAALILVLVNLGCFPAVASVCNINIGSRTRAERICFRAGFQTLEYTRLLIRGGIEDETNLGYGCDCGGPYRRPLGVTAVNLCIRIETSTWKSCATMECEYGDQNPWCMNTDR